MPTEIIVNNLKKTYRVPLRNPGLLPAVRSLFRPVYKDVHAVDGIGFRIGQGETVGFIGPNGAGKTTTLKMLSGLLHPTAGEVSVAGFRPWERKMDFLRQICMLMGNKSQLYWENTISDSLYMIKEIYNVSDKDFHRRMDELVSLLEIQDLLPKLARNLSLGERAKCEFAAALIYRPQILFLDEPTLGLDVSMQLKLRDFIREYSMRHSTTIILTSHYMADIMSLCSRVILINEGKLVFDGQLQRLADRIAPFKLIKVTAADETAIEGLGDRILSGLSRGAAVVEQNGRSITIRVDKAEMVAAASWLLAKLPLNDLTVEDPPIEAVIDQVYREGVSA